MIMGSFGRYSVETAHDHETTPGGGVGGARGVVGSRFGEGGISGWGGEVEFACPAGWDSRDGWVWRAGGWAG